VGAVKAMVQGSTGKPPKPYQYLNMNSGHFRFFQYYQFFKKYLPFLQWLSLTTYFSMTFPDFHDCGNPVTAKHPERVFVTNSHRIIIILLVWEIM
jgi:hypothetical protein